MGKRISRKRSKKYNKRNNKTKRKMHKRRSNKRRTISKKNTRGGINRKKEMQGGMLRRLCTMWGVGCSNQEPSLSVPLDHDIITKIGENYLIDETLKVVENEYEKQWVDWCEGRDFPPLSVEIGEGVNLYTFTFDDLEIGKGYHYKYGSRASDNNWEGVFAISDIQIIKDMSLGGFMDFRIVVEFGNPSVLKFRFDYISMETQKLVLPGTIEGAFQEEEMTGWRGRKEKDGWNSRFYLPELRYHNSYVELQPQSEEGPVEKRNKLEAAQVRLAFSKMLISS